ncbi:type 1 glutamine amidotransferase [Luethyella okanaganae]|uniref:Lipid II isoglutaminyl synthase (glutamine-hydrolyzing) subunit GatD n=1 Tax=Luethyella okanaganae TaxID=69372 RepID=A0ABW1VG26_9MICO
MTAQITIVSLFPSLLDTNGDAANARVLARRADWAGTAARVVVVESVEDLPAGVDAVVIGSGTDADLLPARDALMTLHDELRRWATEGVPILAVGTGWELLSGGVELANGTEIDGLGVLPGRAVPRQDRVSDDLVVTSRYGRLIGYENHARDYIHAEGSPLGRVLYGSGNGRDSRQEGVVMGDVFGTHLHGPVLAKNPGLTDHLLTSVLAREGVSYAPAAGAGFVDEMARAARNQIAVRLGLDSE